VVVETTTVARAIHQASARRSKVTTGRTQAHSGVPVDIASCAHGPPCNNTSVRLSHKRLQYWKKLSWETTQGPRWPFLASVLYRIGVRLRATGSSIAKCEGFWSKSTFRISGQPRVCLSLHFYILSCQC